MEERKIIKESVRGIVELVLRSGSLDDRFISRGRALEGTKAHIKLQKDNEKIYENYQKEIKLQRDFIINDIVLQIEGRIDGIIINKDQVIIEEIKSTYKNLIYIDEEYNEMHWAQSKIYGYIYCLNNDLPDIYIRLSYYNLNTDEVKSFEKIYTLEQLSQYAEEIIAEYINIASIKINLLEERDQSINQIKFPFPTYRKGQRELAVNCYNAMKQQGIMFAQAPTGIGKTISTIFPAVKSIGNGIGGRIIYLTSKNITRVVAENAYINLRDDGLKIKVVSITAKEKMCLNNEVKCNADDCIYAKDYFSKLNKVIKEIIDKEDIFTREVILKYAAEYKVCPFELSLELTGWCDSIVCDYNYAFDPRVRLRRIFEEQGQENILLIDEAHNLVNRARDMYSGEISKSSVMSVCKILKGKVPNLYKIAKRINNEIIEIRRELEEKNLRILYHNAEYKEIIREIRFFISEADDYLIKGKGTEGYDEVLQFYYDIKSFASLSELYSDKYTTIIRREKNDVTIKIFCIDPSENIKEILKSSYSTIIFSATLFPIKYYVDLLGGDNDSYRLRLDSPFDKENLKTYVYPLDMRYEERRNNISHLCQCINKFVHEEEGNYIVFLPSFEYMKEVYAEYVKKYGEENTMLQKESMSEKEKEEFLDSFQNDSKILAFAVVGGMFSEGVDLPGKRLIGAAVVGVGFPKVSLENNIIAEYYGENGFDYAYTYPGLNKILQSAGRVIRTEEDKGRILFVDKRYINNRYSKMLSKDWDMKIYQ